MQNKRKEQGSRQSTYLKGIILGSLWAVVCSLILLLFFAFTISQSIFSEKVMRGSIVVICIISCFTGALVGVSKCRKRVVPLSLSIGAVIFIVQLVMGFVCFKETFLLNSWELVLGADLLGGIAAGLVYRKKSNRNRKK